MSGPAAAGLYVEAVRPTDGGQKVTSAPRRIAPSDWPVERIGRKFAAIRRADLRGLGERA